MISLRVTYVGVKPDYGPTEVVREYVKTRKDWNYVELQAAHDAMVDQPQAVIDIIRGLVAMLELRRPGLQWHPGVPRRGRSDE